MVKLSGIYSRVLLTLSAAVLFQIVPNGNPANAQQFSWPEEPENLQVLDDDITGAGLGQVMRGFATSLGVRCEHCHVGEGMDLTKFDFAADDKTAKRKARLMLKMVAALNDNYLSQLSDIEARTQPELQVGCITCHRGRPRPVMLGDVLLQKLESDGFDATIAEYRDLRERHYGGFSYDFSAGVLTGLGEQLSNAGDHESAIGLIELEIEMNGESASVYYTLGGIQVGANLVDDAIKTYTKGSAMAPDDWKPFFQAELDQLTGNTEQQ